MDDKTHAILERQNPWWLGKEFDSGIERLASYPGLERHMKKEEILLLVGPRRSGKSTILYQLIKSLLTKGTNPKNILFMNLDEPFLQSMSDDPSYLTGLIDEYQTKNKTSEKTYVFADEIQNAKHGIQTAKIIYDTQKKIKLILTDSTSSMLQSQATARLSGRYFHTMIYPLSYAEYLTFRQVKNPSITEKKQHLQDYLQYGGFPKVVLETDPQSKQETLKNYYQTICLKDIIYPHKIRNNKELYDLTYYLVSNTAKPFSYQNLAKTLDTTPETIKEYIKHIEDSYLIQTVTKYDPSVKKQMANQKKVYCIDTGLINAVAFQFTENRGRMLENLAYATLRRKNPDAEIYYHKDAYECDFLLRENGKITQAIQVTQNLNQETEKRETRGLIEAMEKHGLKTGTIITEEQEKTINKDGKTIKAIPMHQWII